MDKTKIAINEALIAELEKIEEPGALIAALVKRFGARAAIGTSGQLSGVALIDMAARAGVKPRVFTVDTRRLFPETYELFGELEKRYGLKIERFAPDATELESMVNEYGEFLFFDSKERQELCCRVRKVHPNQKALNTLDVWINGLRADQSSFRAANARKLQVIEHHERGSGATRPVLKVQPLVDWKEDRLRRYLEERGVPTHKLLTAKLPGGWRYESLGCVLCTTPIGPDEPRRAGRWRWFNQGDDKKECGLHLPPPKKER
jgi:phosphoadenosine phosphosulfate reductase